MALISQKMNLDYIRTFVVLAQSKSMSLASERLNVGISYISRHVKALEEALNTKLVITKTGNRENSVTLTEDGKYFFEKYEQIYNNILLVEKNYLQTKQLANSKITIGICEDLDEFIIKPKLKKFMKEYPNVTIKLINGSKEELVKSLTQYTADFIIDKQKPSFNSKNSKIITNSIYKTKYCLVYNKDVIPNIKDLNQIPFVLPASNISERSTINEYFEKHNVIPKIAIETERSDRLVSYIRDGYGAGIIIKDIAPKDLSKKDLDLDCSLYLSYVEDNLTPSTIEFLKMFNIKK